MVGNPRWREAFVSRNEEMRRWAAADTTGRVHLLDFGALDAAPGAPRGLAANWTDWHYSCKFSWDEPAVCPWLCTHVEPVSVCHRAVSACQVPQLCGHLKEASLHPGSHAEHGASRERSIHA